MSHPDELATARLRLHRVATASGRLLLVAANEIPPALASQADVAAWRARWSRHTDLALRTFSEALDIYGATYGLDRSHHRDRD